MIATLSRHDDPILLHNQSCRSQKCLDQSLQLWQAQQFQEYRIRLEQSASGRHVADRRHARLPAKIGSLGHQNAIQ